MSTAYKIIEELCRLSRQFASPDYDIAIDKLREELQFKVHVYNESHEHNGWVIPPKYEVKKALIKKGANIIYDGLAHPLGVPCHAAAFTGTVDRDTLKKHLWYDHRFPDALPYHFRYSYRPWERDWGFCVTRDFYESLTEGLYEVQLEVSDGEKELKVLEYCLSGSSGVDFAFIAHLDHPGMANDDLAGCAVATELFQRLASKNLRHTYRLLLVQEIIGSEMHLHAHPELRTLQEGLFLEMLGVDVPLVLQRANSTPTAMESAMRACLQERRVRFEEVAFRESAKNDEIVFESYGVPTAALTRYPYAEYHSSRDNLSIISRKSLDEAVELLESVVAWHEDDLYVEKCFTGVACFSNPDIDLYVDPGQPALDGLEEGVSMHRFMEQISLLSKRHSVKVLASLCGVRFQEARAYLERCQKKGLVQLY